MSTKLEIDKTRNTSYNLPTIITLNKEIRAFHSSKKISNVKQAASGRGGNIWKAVKGLYLIITTVKM